MVLATESAVLATESAVFGYRIIVTESDRLVTKGLFGLRNRPSDVTASFESTVAERLDSFSTLKSRF